MPSPSWGALLAFAAASRIITLLCGFLAAHHLPPLPWLEHQSPGPQPFVETFYRWDATHYRQIAEIGYRYQPGVQSSAAFMPGLPMTMVAAHAIGLSLSVAGLIIPNVAFTLGLAFFGRWLLLLGRDTGTVWRSCALLAAFPTAFFFSCPYQESLAFLGVSFALWAWQHERPGLAAAGLFFASFARLTAVALPIGLWLEWLTAKLRRKPARPLGGVLLLGAAWAAGLGLFMLHLHARFDEPLAHFYAHRFWDRQPASLTNLGRTLESLIRRPVSAAALCTGVFFLLGLRAWWKRGVCAGVLVLLPLAMAASTGTPMSLERVVLASFPAFVDLGEVLHSPRWFWGWLAVSIALQGMLLNGYVHWQFVG